MAKNIRDKIKNLYTERGGSLTSLDLMAIADRILEDWGFGGLVDLPPEFRRRRRKEKLTNGKKTCKECGFKIRSRHHEKGLHHQVGQGTYTDRDGNTHSSRGRCAITMGMR